MCRSVFYQLVIPSHILSLLYILLSIALATPPDVPLSALGCVVMGGDFPCFSGKHRSGLRNHWGEISLALGHVAFSPCPYWRDGAVETIRLTSHSFDFSS